MAKKEDKIPISVRVPKSLLIRLNVRAAKAGRKRLDIIISAIEQALKDPQ